MRPLRSWISMRAASVFTPRNTSQHSKGERIAPDAFCRNASFSAYYYPNSANGPSAVLKHGTFLPTPMVSGTTITAADYSVPPPYLNSLHSNSNGVYTLVAGDEWGDLVLLHFSVI